MKTDLIVEPRQRRDRLKGARRNALTKWLYMVEERGVDAKEGKYGSHGSTGVAITTFFVPALNGTSGLLTDFLNEERSLAAGTRLVDGSIP